MIVAMREVEPFNIPPVDNYQAALFMKYMSGSETFSFSGTVRPRSMLIYTLKYAYPRHSFANAWLLSASIDEFQRMCSSGGYSTMEPILKELVIGSVYIEFGGTGTGVNIHAESKSL